METKIDSVADQTTSQGVLYIATGAAFCRAALEAARSVREHSPELGVHIFCDQTGAEILRPEVERLSLTLGSIENPHRRSKVDYLGQTPFERTLYLDVDTRICAPVNEVFELFERFDIALTHAHRRNHPNTRQFWKREFSPAFPHFNGGVIGYRRTPAMLAFLEQWRVSFHSAGFGKDQVTLRELLWESELHIATLPPEYNVRYPRYLRLWKAHPEEAQARILHFKHFVPEKVRRGGISKLARTLREFVMRG